MVALLLALGVDANKANVQGWTTLFVAAFNGHDKVAALLLAHPGVQANQLMQDNTPLFIAAENGRDKVVALLLAHPAVQVNQTTQDGITPLYVAAQNDHDKVVRRCCSRTRAWT